MGLTKVGVKGLDDGTDGQIITYDANGNPVAVGPGTDGQVLTSTGAGSPPAFEAIPTQISLANDANNRVITGTGSGLNGEANLTFDGEQLSVTHAGTTDPENQIVLKGSAIDAGGGSGIFLKSSTNNDANRYGSRIHTVRYANGASDLVFSTEITGGSALQEALKINHNKNVTVSDGDLVIGTSGHGIDFSATPNSGASELLSDYEHGSWTPTIYSSSGSNFTMGTCEGRYAKVGKLVTLWGVINWTGTAGSGVINLGGYPYAPHNTSANNAAVYVGARSGWSYQRIVGLMHQSGYINVQYVDSTSPYNSDNVSVGAVQSSGSIYYGWSYEAA